MKFQKGDRVRVTAMAEEFANRRPGAGTEGVVHLVVSDDDLDGLSYAVKFDGDRLTKIYWDGELEKA